MDESYLTGEPFVMPKAPGSQVFSGAINGESALTLRATRLAIDSRYARIMTVMHDSEQRRPQLRRLGDQLGASSCQPSVRIRALPPEGLMTPMLKLPAMRVKSRKPLAAKSNS